MFKEKQPIFHFWYQMILFVDFLVSNTSRVKYDLLSQFLEFASISRLLHRKWIDVPNKGNNFTDLC